MHLKVILALVCCNTPGCSSKGGREEGGGVKLVRGNTEGLHLTYAIFSLYRTKSHWTSKFQLEPFRLHLKLLRL